MLLVVSDIVPEIIIIISQNITFKLIMLMANTNGNEIRIERNRCFHVRCIRKGSARIIFTDSKY